MKPYLAATVLVNVDAAHNNGSPLAAAIVTAVHADGTVNVRVQYDAHPFHFGHPRPECLTHITFHDTADPTTANQQGTYGAFWPQGPDLETILNNQEKI